ncbi:MAG: UbiD family decarboxylase [Candidatus Sericytochromatia bacterium]|nr:UbiD family decarboxylase [Candidatus Sericytochromatia bacterium]
MRNLRQFIDALRHERDLVTITAEVDPYLEIAEIHRRVIAEGGPALLFTNVKGSKFPVVTNLFGTLKRVELAFGERPKAFVRRGVEALDTLMPPTFGAVWNLRDLAAEGLKIGLKQITRPPVLQARQPSPKLTELPLLQLWPEDGGHFVTLPLVYTEHPDTGKHNLGMYRIQRFDDTTTGIHWQIHKGGGYHYHAAEQKNQALPVTLMIGGPPALMLAAIAPLPEDIPELLLASLLLGEKLSMSRVPDHPLPVVADCEFAITGRVPPRERRPEGPFGDHYGYYSLKHDYPVFHVDQVYHRPDAIFPATVVGKPRQEDYFIGDYLQELLHPLFHIVMPSVRDLWTYGETGFHSLAAARVKDRYPREALVSGFRILGEGQLSLTKILMLTDGDIDLRRFRDLMAYFVARTDFTRDLFVFANVAQDTLDYTGPSVNEGSKAIWLALGEPRRQCPGTFVGSLPSGFANPRAFCPGVLVIEGAPYGEEPDQKDRLAQTDSLADWPMVFLVDDSACVAREEDFLWTVFTRFEPAHDMTAKAMPVTRLHLGFEPPVVIDCRMKPWYPGVVEPTAETVVQVDRRWGDYFPAVT